MPPEPSFSIRLANDGDAVAISQLAYSLFPHAKISYSRNNHFVIAEKNGALCGFAHVRLARGSLVLQGVGVLPSYRRAGLGKSLVAHAIKWAEKEFPHLPLKLKVSPENMPAISLYLGEGFTVSKDEGDAFRMSKAKPT